MRIALLAVGSARDRHMVALLRDYESRTSRYFRFEVVEVPTGSGGGNSPAAVRAREADLLRKRLPKGLDTWALTRAGIEMSSQDFAAALGDMASYGRPGVALLIGGAFGLDQNLVGECSRTFSLSRLTLPHDMARLVLTEQLYRAGTILRGEPYHKGELI